MEGDHKEEEVNGKEASGPDTSEAEAKPSAAVLGSAIGPEEVVSQVRGPDEISPDGNADGSGKPAEHNSEGGPTRKVESLRAPPPAPAAKEPAQVAHASSIGAETSAAVLGSAIGPEEVVSQVRGPDEISPDGNADGSGKPAEHNSEGGTTRKVESLRAPPPAPAAKEPAQVAHASSIGAETRTPSLQNKRTGSLDIMRGAAHGFRRSIENVRPKGGYMDEEAQQQGRGRRSIDVTRMRVSVEMRRNPGAMQRKSGDEVGGGVGSPKAPSHGYRASIERHRRRSQEVGGGGGDVTDEEQGIWLEEAALKAEIVASETDNLAVLVDLQERLEEIMTRKHKYMETGRYRPDAMSEFEIEEAGDLLNIKIAAATQDVKGVGLQRMMGYHHIKKWVDDVPVNEVQLLIKLIPFAAIFLLLIIGAASSHFDNGASIPGLLYTLSVEAPMMWPLEGTSHLIEARISIPAYVEPGHVPAASAGGGHRRFLGRSSLEPSLGHLLRRSESTDCVETGGGHRRDEVVVGESEDHADGDHAEAVVECPEKHGPSIRAAVFTMKEGDESWQHLNVTWDMLMMHKDPDFEPRWVGNYTVETKPQSLLTTFEVGPKPELEYLVMIPTGPVGVGLKLHSLGLLGPSQVGLAAGIMVVVFLMIMTEVLHRTMAAMLGATMVMIVLACQKRVPTLSQLITWMDHGTLGLLWGMMLIVGITMRTGVFEWMGVLACKLAGGSRVRLMLLLCSVTAVLSAFLDNVTTILLIAPVTCKLCKLVDIDPRPYLIAETIFSNIGGTATMIGDPPNIIIGNMLSEHVDFTKFLINLAPGVLITSPFMFFYLWWIFREDLKGTLEADVPTLQQMYPITNRALLVKCGVVLACVILCFFLHPVTHVDPALVAILGAVWLLIAFDMHHCHEALLGVEWDTLLFFAALFVVVEGVGELGLLRAIAGILSDIVRSVPEDTRQVVAIVIIVWASAIFSAFVDNIPFTATMVPVLQQLVRDVDGVSIRPLAWALAFGACFGGNGTLIGASANIVMASKAEVEGFPVTFISFFKIGFPTMLISVCFATAYLAAVNSIFYPWS